MNGKRWTVVFFVGMMLVVLACGPLGNLGDMVSGGQAGTVASLWADVPPYPGAEKVDLEMPLVMRIAVEAASKAIMSGAGDVGGDLEFIAYTTDDSPSEVEAFYGLSRMVAEGWADREDTGCGLTALQTEEGGAMCAFYKEGGNRDSVLIIVAGPQDNGETAVFYIRIDADPELMATAAAE
jgi:hypothetical protein